MLAFDLTRRMLATSSGLRSRPFGAIGGEPPELPVRLVLHHLEADVEAEQARKCDAAGHRSWTLKLLPRLDWRIPVHS
jgi:hypothetical protein